MTDPLAADPRSDGTDMVDAARRRMLREGWDLAVCLTDVPLRIAGVRSSPMRAPRTASRCSRFRRWEPCNCAAGHATPW